MEEIFCETMIRIHKNTTKLQPFLGRLLLSLLEMGPVNTEAMEIHNETERKQMSQNTQVICTSHALRSLVSNCNLIVPFVSHNIQRVIANGTFI